MGTAGNICFVILTATCILLASRATAHDTRQRFDGWFNNLGNPSWGAAGEDILFNVAPAYSDMTYQLAGVDRPNPRVISNNVFDGPTGLPSYRNHTALFAFFSQMVSFELVDATEGMCPLEMVKVPVPKNDSQFRADGVSEEYMPFVRSAYNRDTGLSPNNPRRPINRASSWIDGSFVYGRGEVWCNCLREFTGGRLLTTDRLGYYPGYNHLRLPLDNLPDPITHEKMEPEKQWGFGNVHAHQNPGLMAVALVWFRYHNYVAARLRNSHPAKADERWSNQRWKDEQIFQAARRHVIAVMQNIIVYEYLPALLGRSLPEYKAYNPHLQPSISAIFEAAAIRTYHTQMPPGIYVRGANCSFYHCHSGRGMRMCNTYFRSQEMVKKYGLGDIVRGLASQIAEREDQIIVDDLRGRNYGPLQYSRQDLVVQTIMRGRDHGLPDYNTARKAFHLAPVDTWKDINPALYNSSPEVISKLADTYKDISKLDIYVGGLIEMNEGTPGLLFTEVILEQFLRIRDADRFWFENKENNILTDADVADIKKIKFSDVVREATGLSASDFQKEVFFWNEGDPCQQQRQLKEVDMEECTDYTHYDFFSGSEVSYIGSLVAVGLLPFICILVAYLIAKCKNYNAKKEKKRYQSKMAVKKTPPGPGDIEALEWVTKDTRTPIELHIDSLQCSLVVISGTYHNPRIIKFAPDNGNVDVWMSNNKHNNFLLIRVPKEHDLVIVFNADYERTAFVSNLRRMLTSHKMALQIFESSQRDIIKNAITRHKRNQLLTKFFKRVFAESSNVGELKTAEDMEIYECKDIVNCELSREEFAESLAMKPDSVFINQMFSLIDHDRNGYISFRELLYAVVLFSKGGPEDKMQMLFKMFDMDKSGTLDKEEVTALVKSMLEMAHSDLTSEETDQLVEKMFVTAELDKHGVLTLEDFVKMLAGEQSMMWDVSLEWKGMNRCKYRKKSSSDKTSHNGVSQKTGPVNWDKGHRINFSGMTHPVAAGSSRFAQLVEPVRNYIETYRQHIVCLLLFFGVNLLVFSHKFYYYAIEQEHRGFRSVGGYWVSLSRGGAAGMSFSFSFILLTMCRNLITKLRETVLNQYLPFDAHVTFHVIVAYTAFFFMFLHVFGYCFIFYEVSTQPAEFLCIFREVSLSPTFLPKFHYWLFGTLPGATGVLLIAVICVMYIFAQPIVRTYIFNAFWVSHKLFYLLYVLTLLHGCVRLLQEPNFSYYFAGPAILFTLDKIVSLSRRKRELTILRMEQLPSDITYLEFKRPANFEYKSGQWVRLACTALGKEEYHSLTLTSAPHENTLSVYVMACGPWSWNLKRLCDSQNQSEDPYPKIYIDGPFGTGHQDWYDYEVTILIGGGIGVTPYASILKEFVHMSTINSLYRMKCRKVYFVWVAGNQRHYEWMADVLRQIESIDTKETVETHLFITQLFQNFDLRTTMLYICEEHFQNMAGNSLFTGLKGKTHFGRPNFEMLFQAISNKHPKVKKVGVFSCGPAGLTKSICNACSSVSKFTRTRFPHFYENF